MKIDDNLIQGIFVRELKNRFLCEVLINGELFECYVPSSVKLKHYLKLENKVVILSHIKSNRAKTQYSLFAVRYYNKLIVLNLSYANKLVEEYIITTRNFESCTHTLLREKVINGYKADFIIQEKQVEVIEVKAILSSRNSVKFPNIYSERMIDQLKRLSTLLKNNIKVSFYIVSLSPIIKEVILNSELSEFNNLFIDCVNYGMTVKVFSISKINNELIINPDISVKILN